MISAIKRLVKNDTSSVPPANSTQANNSTNQDLNSSDNHISPNRLTSPAHSNFLNNGVQMISQSLQKKFSKGINYNSMFEHVKANLSTKISIKRK